MVDVSQDMSIVEANMKDHYLGVCIGQSKARQLLSFYYEAFERRNIHRNILFLAPRGQGKTMLCEAIAQKLKKPAYEFHSETVKNVDHLFDQILFPYAIDRDVTLIFDEIHCLKPKVAEILLSILAPNPQNRNVIRYSGSSFTFDFRRFTFLGATTEPHRVLLPLRSRLKEVTLTDYSLEELKLIIQKGAQNISLNKSVLDYLVKYVRSNARSAFSLGQEIVEYCGNHGRSVLHLNDAKELVSILDIYEHGFSALELQILAAIAKSRNASLTRLAAKSGLTPQGQRDFERELLARDLIDIDGGRQITEEGIQYLERNYEQKNR